MKKLLVLVLALVAIAVIGLFVVQFFLGSIVKAGVNRVGPHLAQTNVVLDGARISAFTGQGELTGLRVANPQGWSDRDAFSFESIQVDVEPRSLFDDKIVVNELIIDRPSFVYESKLVSSNIGDLMKNIQRGRDTPDAQSKDGTPKRIEVKHLVLRDGKITVGVGPAATTLEMKPIEMRDLGTREGGLTPNQLAVAIMGEVTPVIVAAAAQNVQNLGESLGGSAGEAVKKAGGFLKGLVPQEQPKQTTEPKK
jgi:hypothetical protein